MALTLTQVGLNKVVGDEKETTWDAVASGTYLTAGEVITAASVLLGAIKEIRLPPVTNGGFYPIAVTYNADGSVNLVFLEPSAAAAGVGSPFQVKTNAEAYIASTGFRFTVRGPYA